MSNKGQWNEEGKCPGCPQRGTYEPCTLANCAEQPPAPVAVAVAEPPQRISLARAVAEVEAICLMIDELGVVPEDVMAKLDDATLAVAERTDAWIGRLEAIDALVEVGKRRRDRVAAELAAVTAVGERAKAYLFGLVESAPGVVFKGERGKLATQKNGGVVPLHVAVQTYPFSADKTVTDHELDALPELDEFIEARTVYVLKTDAIRAALAAGRELPGIAALGAAGRHLRVR